jgi:hypothetical protein
MRQWPRILLSTDDLGRDQSTERGFFPCKPRESLTTLMVCGMIVDADVVRRSPWIGPALDESDNHHPPIEGILAPYLGPFIE